MTGAEIDRLMRERPRPGRPDDHCGGTSGEPSGGTVAARLPDDQITALARLRIALGQHDDQPPDEGNPDDHSR